MRPMQYPPQLEIAPLTHPPRAAINVPGSKSITNRALVLAALTASAEQPTILEGVLQSEDTQVMVQCLRKIGIHVEADWLNSRLSVRQGRGIKTVLDGGLFIANSGTSMRFLT